VKWLTEASVADSSLNWAEFGIPYGQIDGHFQEYKARSSHPALSCDLAALLKIFSEIWVLTSHRYENHVEVFEYRDFNEFFTWRASWPAA
jgi:hypothetical protein